MLTVTDLASKLGLKPDAARRVAVQISNSLGIEPSRRQVTSTRRQMCWTNEEAAQIVEERRRLGFRVPDNGT